MSSPTQSRGSRQPARADRGRRHGDRLRRRCGAGSCRDHPSMMAAARHTETRHPQARRGAGTGRGPGATMWPWPAPRASSRSPTWRRCSTPPVRRSTPWSAGATCRRSRSAGAGSGVESAQLEDHRADVRRDPPSWTSTLRRRRRRARGGRGRLATCRTSRAGRHPTRPPLQPPRMTSHRTSSDPVAPQPPRMTSHRWAPSNLETCAGAGVSPSRIPASS